MLKKSTMLRLMTAVIGLGVLAWGGCSNNGTTNPESLTAAGNNGKIAVTTSSEEARKEFLQGRDKFERLLAQDSIQHFDKAISLDPNFALAELGRANSAQSAKEFFEHLKKAVSLADKVSEGEKLFILAAEAGANAEAAKQKEYLEKLVSAFPNDERAHFNLGGYFFGQQDYAHAIEHYKKATGLALSYSPAYNLLGYAYRQDGDYANAEQAFKKYIELIPNDPNPYDSYAELLLKMGRFDESIAQYRKALTIDPNFVASHLGISADLTYQGKHDEAVTELQKIMDKARSDGQRRNALFGLTVVNVDRGKMDDALAEMDKQYALAEKINDAAAMSGDLQAKGAILLESGKYDEAKSQFDRALKVVEDSSLSQEIKDNTKLFHHFNLATVATGKKDMAAAKAAAEEFRKVAESSKNSNQVRQAHELNGRIALAEKQYDTAISELGEANLQNPYNLYRLALAYQGKGDQAKAKEFAAKAAEFNPLPQLNFGFVRVKASRMSGEAKE